MSRMENVLFMRAEDAGTGHQALERLRRADADGALTLRGATVITRDAEGSVDFPDTLDTTGTARGFLAGGLIGGLVGILGGPLGVMAGFGAGGLIGGARDARRATADNVALQLLTEEVPPDTTVLVAEVAEDGPEAADEALAPYGTPVRHPADRVREEVEAAIAEGRRSA
ncbi:MULTISPECIES: DUF1269 domain-containing protein [Streptomyces]|uniref:DUF1269 domain-containing protein n=1 Tax=Streptomyces TaxID=1883 RepID=UPI00163C67C1|nr:MULTISPECIES: DUF1269 domain-containing protein [Streptomyces]MBC2878113.1 DUF1269 domain-containing protein [Streptomyces sp. TYQ1024]UBI40056.1 DUF1269 domain-containing protein [Streptomyces mobaraensis]UKW32636.1 DUF1269 domain-containing protein [Streptomyces sp. TYQ1024]